MDKVLNQLPLPQKPLRVTSLNNAPKVLDNDGVLGSAVAAVAPPKTKEITLFGSYKWPDDITEADKIQFLFDGQWGPDSSDFAAVVGKRHTEEMGNFEAILSTIGRQKDKSIRRLNFFTHANSLILGVKGTVVPGDVIFDEYVDAAEIIFMAENYESITDDKGRTYKITDIQKKFADDGIFVLYACHLGADRELMKAICTLLQVSVYGFEDAILYCPPHQEHPPFKNKGMRIALSKNPGGCGKNDTTRNWRDLIDDETTIKLIHKP